MHEFLKDAAATSGIVTVERLHHASLVACPGMGACGLPAAGAGLRRHVLIVPTVQIFLHMGDDHVALGNQDTASGMQLQSFDKGQVMEARPGYLTAVNLHRVKYCNRGNLTAAPCLPFYPAEDRLIGVILKFEGNAVIVMVSGPAEACGVGEAVEAQHHPVDGDVPGIRKFCHLLDLRGDVVRLCVRRDIYGGAYLEAELGQDGKQATAAVP